MQKDGKMPELELEDVNARSFGGDVQRTGKYLYSNGRKLSARLAMRRHTEAMLALTDFRDRRVLDVGCGDGTYTVELYEEGRPALVEGIDIAAAAIEAARTLCGDRRIQFRVGSAYELPYASDTFDVVCLRGVLHHMDQPWDAIKEALRVAPAIVVVEPNGYSLARKMLECASRYHREHNEKSFSPNQLRKWVRNLGGEITGELFVGLVPLFTFDLAARALKFIEPFLEATPIARSAGCALFAFTATRRKPGKSEGPAIQ